MPIRSFVFSCPRYRRRLGLLKVPTASCARVAQAELPLQIRRFFLYYVIVFWRENTRWQAYGDLICRSIEKLSIDQKNCHPVDGLFDSEEFSRSSNMSGPLKIFMVSQSRPIYACAGTDHACHFLCSLCGRWKQGVFRLSLKNMLIGRKSRAFGTMWYIICGKITQL